MEPEEEKISVWICQEEKLVSGLSRRTTCADVVRALLEDSRRRGRRRQAGALRECGAGVLWGAPQCYCVVEKWRGFERTLPAETRILRLWAAWGQERENVRFVLVRSEASLPNAGPRSAEARVVPSRESPSGQSRPGTAAPRAGMAPSQERQRRVVRKAFRKLARLNRRRGQAHPREPPGKERMETLVHLVLSQDHTIRQQLKRLRDLDREIDRFEARVHLDRVRRHGANYVQDTYLVGGEPESPGDEEAPAELEELARRREQVARLQDQRRHQEELLEQLSGELQEELNQRWMRRRREELAAARGSGASLSEADCSTTELAAGEPHVERERVHTQLSASLYIGLRLSTDLKGLRTELERCERALEDKEQEVQLLEDSLRALDVEEEEEEEEEEVSPLQILEQGMPTGPRATSSPQHQLKTHDAALGPKSLETPVLEGGEDAATVSLVVWREPATQLRKDCEDNDEDSDTGLSSMHSQDSDTVPVCESLV